MYTVDLLEGRKMPPRSKPVSVALITAALLMPVAAASLLASQYFTNQMQLYVLRRQVSIVDLSLTDLADVEAWLADLSAHKQVLLERMEALSLALSARVQLSNLLADLAAGLPDSVRLDRMAVVGNEIQGRPTEKPVRHYTLELGVLTREGPEVIEQLIQHLQFDSPLRLRAQGISIVSQERKSIEGQDFLFCSVHCALEL